MGKNNIERNRKRFRKQILGDDEQILGGCLDGLVYIIRRYDEAVQQMKQGATMKKDEYHMTLIPTDKRIVAFQSGGMFTKDKFAQLPYTEIDEITRVQKVRPKKHTKDPDEYVCVVEFIAPDDSRYPSIVLKFDSQYPEDFQQFDVILRGISKLAGVKIDDFSDDAENINNAVKNDYSRNNSRYQTNQTQQHRSSTYQ